MITLPDYAFSDIFISELYQAQISSGHPYTSSYLNSLLPVERNWFTVLDGFISSYPKEKRPIPEKIAHDIIRTLLQNIRYIFVRGIPYNVEQMMFEMEGISLPRNVIDEEFMITLRTKYYYKNLYYPTLHQGKAYFFFLKKVI